MSDMEIEKNNLDALINADKEKPLEDNETKNTLTDEQLDFIAKIAEENRIQSAKEVEVNPDAELEKGEAEIINGKVFGISGDGAKEILHVLGEDNADASVEKNTSVDLLTMESGDDIVIDEDAPIEKSANFAKDTFDLSDEEVFQVMQCLENMKKNPKYPVYANLPEKMQLTISKMAYDNHVDPTKLNDISRMILTEMINQAGVDQALVDLEKALDDALNVPSIVDMYSEHTHEVMDKLIPETIESIKDEFPDKAHRLEQIREAFNSGYNFSFAKQYYEDNARLRKTMRRYETEYDRTIDHYNYMNEKSNFKMSDAHEILPALKKVLITDANNTFSVYNEDTREEMPEMQKKLIDLNVTEDDIKKFCIMITRSCENLNPNDPVDAAYMYYLVRNIISLIHVNESKTAFAAELINNICDVITFIRDKESEFRESNKQSRNKKNNS